MVELRYTLLTDGSSDQVLIPILNWLLRQHNVRCAIQPQWANLSRVPRAPRRLFDRIKWSLKLYPCDMLFVHRDAERETHTVRVAEIRQAVNDLPPSESNPVVCVVPVRMQEAWLLFDEIALRHAAGNPRGEHPLQFPPVASLEQLPDPKSNLYELLREASGLGGRRRKKFPVTTSARRVAEFVKDFSPLRTLSAFRALEAEVQELIESQSWDRT